MVDAVELRAVALFGSLDDQELESLASCAELVEIPSEGVDLTRQGDFGHAVFAVVGRHRRRHGRTGCRCAGSARGDVFGEIAVLSSGRRTATVTSTSPMRLVSVFKRDLWRFADANPGFDDALRQATIRRLTRRAADQTGSGSWLERTFSSRASRDQLPSICRRFRPAKVFASMFIRDEAISTNAAARAIACSLGPGDSEKTKIVTGSVGSALETSNETAFAAIDEVKRSGRSRRRLQRGRSPPRSVSRQSRPGG